MAKLSPSEIKDAASKAGFSGKDLDIAVAVAMAESGGDARSHNSKPPDDSYGLWQINMLGDMGPSRRKAFGITSNDQLYDPAINARAAYSIFKSQGWERGWTTYKSGKYKNFMPPVQTDDVGAIVDGANPITGVSAAINGFSSTIFKAGTNLAGIGIALGLLVVGVVFLIMSSSAAKKAANVAANVVPGGSVVKSVIKKAGKV
jgi:Lysozyme like domain